MAALAGSRDTKRRGEDVLIEDYEFDVAASTKIYQGSMVATDASGNAVPASASAALIVWGRAELEADNSSGLAGAKRVRVKRGAFRWANGDSIAKADIGKLCYASDDQTVNKGDGGAARPLAGRIVDVDSSGVYVEHASGPFGGQITAAGTYAPTMTGVANVDGTPTVTQAFFQRVGNIVRVEATVVIDPTAATTVTQARMSLPVASGLTAAGDLSGVAVREGGAVATASGSCKGDATNDAALIDFTSVGTGAETWHVSFTYIVK
jgi:hypothetical protein